LLAAQKFTPWGKFVFFMEKMKMNKIEKAIAKLYFAIGETAPVKLASSENPAFMAEYSAAFYLRGTGERLGLKYISLGSSSALRAAKSTPKGKRAGAGKPGKCSPRGGKMAPTVKQLKRLPPRSKRTVEDDYLDDGDFEDED
jgi:hypothetical protein